MSLLLNPNITFTEEEYKSIFCDTQPKLNNLRKIISKKGVIPFYPYDLNTLVSVNELTPDVIENFIFNSTIREIVPDLLLHIYKRLVLTLSYDQVWFYVKCRRFQNHFIGRYFIPGVLNIIFSNSQGSDIMCYDVNKYDYTHPKDIKEWNGVVTKLLVSTKDNELCSCRLEPYLNMTCGCCIRKMILFANDCTMKLGEVIFIKEIHRFLLFLNGFELLIDIKYVIGLNFIRVV